MKNEKLIGRLNYWNSIRGFGFAHVMEDSRITRYFVHISEIVSGEPEVGATVRFDSVENKKGLMTVNVELTPNRAAQALVGAAGVA